MRQICLAALALVPGLAHAQAVLPCVGYQANAQNLIDPVADNVRYYAQGAIRILALDTVEPACCWAYLMVTFPAEVGVGGNCALIARTPGGEGYAGVSLSEASAAYDPTLGLSVTVPMALYRDDGTFPTVPVTITINQATETVTAR